MSQGDVQLADEIAGRATLDNYRELAVSGYNLWELCKASILVLLESPVALIQDERSLKLIQLYYRQAIISLTAICKIFDALQPTALIVTQGCPHVIRPSVEEARRRGIITVAAEGAFSGSHFFCDSLTGMIINRHAGGRVLGDWFETRSFNSEKQRVVRDFVAESEQIKRPEHVTAGVSDPGEIRKLLGIEERQKIAVFIGQVYTDASITMDSRVFPDPIVLIRRVVDYFKMHPDWFLVIRLHPKEAGGKYGVAFDVPEELLGQASQDGVVIPYNKLTERMLAAVGIADDENVRIISGGSINTQALLSIADLGITCNSQAGFEMALRYKPVVVAGDAFYGRKGFTYDVTHQAALEATLETARVDGGMAEQERLMIDHYAYELLHTCLFRRDLHGECGRLLRMFEGVAPRGVRGYCVRKSVAGLEKNAIQKKVPWMLKDI